MNMGKPSSPYQGISYLISLISLCICLLLPVHSFAKNTPNPNKQSIDNASKGVLLDHIIAIVNDRIILNSELNQRTQLVLRNIQQSNPQLAQSPELAQIEKQILERMILEKIQMSLAGEMGIRISDHDLNQTLNGIAQDQQLTLSEFRRQLLDQGQSYPAFRDQVRTEMIVGQVQRKLVGARIQITEQDINHFLQSAQGKQMLSADYRISHILIATPLDPSPEEINQAQTQAKMLAQQLLVTPEQFHQLAVTYSAGRHALEGGDLGWRPGEQLPSLFANTVYNMQVGDIAGPIKSPSGFHIIQLKDKRGGSTKVINQTQAQHILIKPNALRSTDESRQLIDTIYQRLQGGANFADMAKTYSDDDSNARKGGDLGWVSPGTLVPAFEQTMQNTEAGTYSTPFLTEFGWHIVKVLDRRTQDVSSENRNQQARSLVYRRKFEEELQLWLQEIRQEAYVELRIE